MQSATEKLLRVIGGALVCWFSVLPIPANAQGSPGQNGVYNSSNSTVGSWAFVDASMFASAANPNFCAILNFILNPSNHILPSSAGAVVDARGLNSTNTIMTCSVSPWGSGSGYLSVPSTILLPAGTIVIPATWILPNKTRLIGEGDALNPTSSTPVPAGTIIQAKLNFSVNTDMFDLGDSSHCPLTNGIPVCNSVSVENMVLDGQGQFINGIGNSNAQEGTYVDHVSLFQIRGTGLMISANANNSGPYSNITFDTGSYSGATQTVCASINGTTSTRGIHSLTCTSENNDPSAAILLDASNNSIEDVRIVGFYDGIRVGANANAQSNVLRNIVGDSTPGTAPTPVIIVHIKNAGHMVSDLSIVGANNAGGSSSTFTIADDLTGPQLVDTSVGIYAIGESAGNGVYARYTTSPSAATWATGSVSPTPLVGNCSRGSLYSCTGGRTNCGNAALWACAMNGSTLQWMAVK